MTLHRILPNPPRLQRGNALVVAVVLLLLASIITLLTLNVGLFEQRTSGNDARAKLVSEVAEAGIAQGAEFFRMPGALPSPPQLKIAMFQSLTSRPRWSRYQAPRALGSFALKKMPPIPVTRCMRDAYAAELAAYIRPMRAGGRTCGAASHGYAVANVAPCSEQTLGYFLGQAILADESKK